MCSVTFWPRPGGYVLGMNRDENRSRIAGLPPAIHHLASGNVMHPSEPSGGTWISVNDRGIAVALVNWYAIKATAPRPVASRGEIILALRGCRSSSEAGRIISATSLAHTNPFRLAGIFPDTCEIIEWRWNLSGFEQVIHPWQPMQWLSSGFDEPAAQRSRGGIFNAARLDADCGEIRWLRRLHASHEPGCGPFSTCMHRKDAATVSYTECEASSLEVTMRYSSRPLCERADMSSLSVSRVCERPPTDSLQPQEQLPAV